MLLRHLQGPSQDLETGTKNMVMLNIWVFYLSKEITIDSVYNSIKHVFG